MAFVERGLDLKFPLVLRAMAPLENLLLAARCCRQARQMKKTGKLIIFEPDTSTGATGVFSSATAVTRNLLRKEIQPST